MDKAFQFKIQIEGITKPPVWRRVIVPDTFTFEQFHHVIQAAFGWTNSHLFQFCLKSYDSSPTITIPYDDFDDNPVEDAREIILKDIFQAEKQKFTYIYDFGDRWHHKITLEAILQDSSEKASCIAGKGACPPEDCGGVWRYKYLKEVMSNPEDPAYEVMRDRLGLDPDDVWLADFFDIGMTQVNMEKELIKSSLEVPEFNHSEVKIFYHNGYEIDRDTLHAIMALPRQTLIEDMQKMLMDSIERFEYFVEYEGFETNFPIHAMYVLSSLRAEEAFDTLLLIMSRDEDFLDFWFGDLVTEEFWQYIYLMGQNRTDKLMDFFKTPGNYLFVRSEVLVAITQIAIRQPERKQEMVEWKADALEFLYNNINDNDIFDSFLFDELLYNLSIFGDKKLLPLIEKCYASGEVNEKETGTLKEITKNLDSEEIDSYFDIYKLYTNIDQFYDEWESWAVALDEEDEGYFDDDEFDEFDDEFDENNNSFPDNYKSTLPYVADPKTGRNDLCPCGSGKKYKKCCGAN